MKYKIRNEEVLKNSENLLEAICKSRGVDYNMLPSFIYPKKDVIQPPEIYKNLIECCDIILSAIKNNERICFVVDCDVDGYCSSSMMINYLREVLGFCNITWILQPRKQHGLNESIMESIINSGCNIIIIPDASSNDFEQHKKLKELGKTVLVIDHHEADRYSENAIVVNNQLNTIGNKTLSGAGMVMKVLEYLDFLNGTNKAHEYMDLCSIALVADCVPTIELETRYYVINGLANVQNPLILQLLDFNKERSFEQISFSIAPVINAFVRVGSDEEKLDLFNSMVGFNYKRTISIRGQGEFDLDLPEYISRLGSRIKSRQNSRVEKAIKTSEIKADGLQFTFCIIDEFADRDLTGLIGNKIVDKYEKPTLVLKDYGDVYSGSGRSPDTFISFKSFLNDTGLFELCEGHQGAFGVIIKKENFEKLVEFSKNISEEEMKENQKYIVDKAYIDKVSAFDIMSVSELNQHWGRGFDKPQFYIELNDLQKAEMKICGVKRDTIRIKFDNITYIKFKCSKEEIEEFERENKQQIQIIGTFDVNEYYDNLYPQVEIKKMKSKFVEKSKKYELHGSEVTKNCYFGGIKW